MYREDTEYIEDWDISCCQYLTDAQVIFITFATVALSFLAVVTPWV